jgi:acyl-CoA reductase-like NAD-dependent aldehyde dehydrogenase
VKGFLEDAQTNGKVIAGGQALEREGYFIAPTIVHDIGEMRAWSVKSSSGPSCRYHPSRTSRMPSLAPTIRIMALVVRCRTVWANKWLDMPFDVPFRGAKHSGIGAENGQEGIEEYTQARIINVAL